MTDRLDIRLAARVSLIAIAALGLGACSNIDKRIDAADKQDQNRALTPQALASLGDAAAAQGNYEAAAPLYARASQADPKNVAIQLKFADSLERAGRPQAADTIYRNVLALDADNTKALGALGRLAIANDKPQKAAEYYSRAIATAGKTPDHRHYGGLGVALDMSGDHKDAREAYRKGLAIKPDDLALTNNLGLSYALSGRYKSAISTLRKVIRKDPNSTRARHNLALAYGLAGQNKRAMRLAETKAERKQFSKRIAYYRWLRKKIQSDREVRLAKAKR